MTALKYKVVNHKVKRGTKHDHLSKKDNMEKNQLICERQ